MRFAVVFPQVLTLLAVALGPCSEPAGAESAAKPRAATARQEELKLRFGVQASYAQDSHFGIGGRAVWSLPWMSWMRPFELVTSFDYFFPPGTDGPVKIDAGHWDVNANAVYSFKTRFRPFAGGGLNLAHRSAELSFLGQPSGTVSATGLGLNLLGGLRFGARGKRQPFAEVRLQLGEVDQFVVSGGLLF